MLDRSGRSWADVVNSRRRRDIAAKEVAMRTARFRRIVPATLLLAGCWALSGFPVGGAQAQFVNPVPPPPPPVFNPASPNTVPQVPEAPVSPGLPSALPGSSAPGPDVVLPPDQSPPPTTARSHRPTVPETEASNAAPTRGGRHRAKHHRLSREGYGRVTARDFTAATAPYYISPFAWGFDSPYHSCVWQRSWDGYWAPVCI
jgi:hypothetical protein